MAKRIAALIFIFACTSAAWMILGATIFARTDSSDSALRGRVASTWGAPQEQSPPTASWTQTHMRKVETEEDNKKITRTVEETTAVYLPLESSRVEVSLGLEHRQKGLLWYSTYKVGFSGDYVFRNTSDHEQAVTFTLNFPAAQAIYDDLVLVVDDAPLPITNQKTAVTVSTKMAAGATARLRAAYRSQGLEGWRYKFGDDVAQVRDFQLRMRTNFQDIDFAENTLSPTEKRLAGSGWELTWTYKNLLTGYQIGMPMPEKLQPGPLAGQISFFAPVSLFFFFFIMFILTALRDIELHPMNYFFLAAAFFAFHLLLAYLVDHISIHAAFLICSAVSIFLVVSYLRLAVGMRFAAVEAAGAQLIYLVLFSYAFFFKGFTGLTIAIGAILTLFVVMQMTGRIRWAEKFARRTPPPAA